MQILGNKIKKMRKELYMTQEELAKGIITRNMLSQIENNIALPSLETLKLIAERLNFPIGYFLSDTDDETYYKKIIYIDKIKKYFQSGQYELCIENCGKLNIEDDEINYFLAMSYFNLAYDLFKKGKLKKSEVYFIMSVKYSENTIYLSENIEYSSKIFLEFIKTYSSANNQIDVVLRKLKSSLSENNSYIELLTYLYIINLYENDAPVPQINIISNNVYLKHIEAKKYIKNNDYSAAKQILDDLITFNASLIVKYKIIYDLEICCTHTEDYKNAYKYATLKSEIYNNFS